MNMIMQFWPELAPPKQCPSAKTPPSRSTLRVISVLAFKNQIRSVDIFYWNMYIPNTASSIIKILKILNNDHYGF